MRSAYRIAAIACGAFVFFVLVTLGDEVLFLAGAVKLHGEVRQVTQTGRGQWAYSIAVDGPAVVSRVECFESRSFFGKVARRRAPRPGYRVGDGVDVLFNSKLRTARFWSPPALLVFNAMVAGAGTWGAIRLWREGSRHPRPQVPGFGRQLLDFALVLGAAAAVAAVIGMLMWLLLSR